MATGRLTALKCKTLGTILACMRVRYLRGRIKAGTHGLSAVERAYGRLWSMADRTWQIEHRGEFRLALRRATSLPRGNKRDYVSYKTLVQWRFACALRGSARGFCFIDPLGLRPRGLCTVATRTCHVNHAPPSYNYSIDSCRGISVDTPSTCRVGAPRLHRMRWDCTAAAEIA